MTTDQEQAIYAKLAQFNRNISEIRDIDVASPSYTREDVGVMIVINKDTSTLGR